MLDREGAEELCLGRKEWVKFGLVHHMKSWILLYLLALFQIGQLKKDLQKDANPATGEIGEFPHIRIGWWGDAMDGTGKNKNVSQGGIMLIDPEQTLLVDGASQAMAQSIWLESENFFIQMFESYVAESSLSQTGAAERARKCKFIF
eukprot:SAG31_NODE_14060_length_829_cov_1.676712_1_plen_147_part_00